jgi:hypothetical protein
MLILQLLLPGMRFGHLSKLTRRSSGYRLMMSLLSVGRNFSKKLKLKSWNKTCWIIFKIHFLEKLQEILIILRQEK